MVYKASLISYALNFLIPRKHPPKQKGITIGNKSKSHDHHKQFGLVCHYAQQYGNTLDQEKSDGLQAVFHGNPVGVFNRDSNPVLKSCNEGKGI